MKRNCILVVLVIILAYAAFSRESVKASGSVTVYEVLSGGSLGQQFRALGGNAISIKHTLDASDVVGFSCTSGKDGDTCYVLAK